MDGKLAGPIYLDNNATTPMTEDVKQAIVESLDLWGNPSSCNRYGEEAMSKIVHARNEIATLVGSSSRHVIFTSGGTEGNNRIAHSVLSFYQSECLAGKTHGKMAVLSSAIEHPSVLNTLRLMEAQQQIELILLTVSHGRYDTNRNRVYNTLERITRGAFVYISLMMANGETGVVQPVAEIAEAVRQRGHPCYLHVDACQAVGKMKVDIKKLTADSISMSGHKFYGPRIGAVVVGNEQTMKLLQQFPLLSGGGQELGIRSGTENTPMIAGLGQAARFINQLRLVPLDPRLYESRMRETCDYFEERLKKVLSRHDVFIHFQSTPERLCNTSSVCFPRLPYSSRDLLAYCEDTFIASSGSACHARSGGPSPTLLACGIDSYSADRTIRFSFGRETTLHDVNVVIDKLKTTLDLFSPPSMNIACLK